MRGAALLVAVLAAAPSTAAQFRDDRNHTISISRKPARIAALSPHLAEIVFADSPVRALRALPTRYVTPDLIQRQTPRIVAGARMICEQLDEIRRVIR